MGEIVDFILKTNTFNFFILFLCFALLAHYLKFGDMLENLKNAVIKKIEDAKSEKENALKNLNNAQNEVANLENDIENKIQNAKISAENVASRINDETLKNVENIIKNSENIIQSEEKSISSELLKEASLNAVSLSREYIKSELSKRPELHKKFIHESIAELDRINL